MIWFIYQQYLAREAQFNRSGFNGVLETALVDWYVLLTAGDKKELEETKKRYNELSEKLMEKNRQYLKLQVGIVLTIHVSTDKRILRIVQEKFVLLV